MQLKSFATIFYTYNLPNLPMYQSKIISYTNNSLQYLSKYDWCSTHKQTKCSTDNTTIAAFYGAIVTLTVLVTTIDALGHF